MNEQEFKDYIKEGEEEEENSKQHEREEEYDCI